MDWLFTHRGSYTGSQNTSNLGHQRALPITTTAAAAAAVANPRRNETDELLMIQQLQNQNQMLRDQLDIANERTEELEDLLQKKEDEEEEEANKPAPKQRSNYAARENPIKLPNGFIDGRSNAQAAFEEKCQLLRDYQKEFGHLNVPTQKPGDKHYKIYQFVTKQRKFYSSFQRGTSDASRITPERIKILEEIGLEWVKKAKTPEESWEENYAKLKQYREKYGHCCLDSEESFDDPTLMGWVRTQRRILKDFRAKVKQLANGEQDRTETNNEQQDNEDKKQSADENGDQQQALGGNGATQQQVLEGNSEQQQQQEEEEEKAEGNSEQNAVEVDDTRKTSNDSGTEKTKQDERPKKKRRLGIPVYWTEEMYEKLLELKCPWLESFEEDSRARSAEKWGVLNSTPWYHKLREFRAYVAKNGDGFVPVQPAKRTPLSRWVREQRRVFDAVQDKSIQTCESYESNFELLKSAGFVFDREALRQKEERLIKMQHEEEVRKRYLASSAGKLEAAMKEQQKAQQALKNAEKVLQDAKRDVQKAKTALNKANTGVKEAEALVFADQVGKTVRVKFRGKGAPHGLAKVLTFRTIKLLGEEVSFYDLEFLETGEKALQVEGMFVSRIDE